MTTNIDNNTRADIMAFLHELSASGHWSALVDAPDENLASEETYGKVSGRLLAHAVANIQAPVADAAEAVPGITVVVEDVRIVLVLDDAAVKSLINGINIGAGVSAAFTAASGAITAILAASGVFVTAAIAGVFITGVAGIFSGFAGVFSALIGEVNKGNGVYLTVTIPQLVVAASFLIASIVVPITAWLTLPAAIAAMLIVPTTRPKE
jgi:hypothetical protein